jgi:hypothetical protein
VIDYRLFEYVFLDPVAVYEQPLLFGALGVGLGYILVHNKNYPLGKQIEEAEIPDLSTNKLRTALNHFISFQKTNQGYVERAFENVKSKNSFIEDAKIFERENNCKALCIVSAENQGSVEHQYEIEIDDFIKRSFKGGKSPELPRTPEAFVEALSPIFNNNLYKNYIKYISIIDPYIEIIGITPKNYSDANLRDETLLTLEKICAQMTQMYEDKILKKSSDNGVQEYLQLNFFFQIKKDFSQSRFEEKFNNHIEKSSLGFFRGSSRPFKLNFYGLREIGSSRVHLRWTFSHSFLIFHHDGVCSLGKRKKGSKEVTKNVWELKKLLDDDDLENIAVEEQNNSHATLRSFKRMYNPKSKNFNVSSYTPSLFRSAEVIEKKEVSAIDA